MFGKIQFIGKPGKLWTGNIQENFTGAFELVEKRCIRCKKSTKQLNQTKGVIVNNQPSYNVENFYVLTGGVGSLHNSLYLGKYKLWNWSGRIGGFLVPEKHIEFLAFGYFDSESVPGNSIPFYAGNTISGYVSLKKRITEEGKIEISDETKSEISQIIPIAGKILQVCLGGVQGFLEKKGFREKEISFKETKELLNEYVSESKKEIDSDSIAQEIFLLLKEKPALPFRINENCFCPPCRQKRAERLYPRLQSVNPNATTEEKMAAVETALASGTAFAKVYESWESIPANMPLGCWDEIAEELIPECGTWDNPSRAFLEDHAREGQVLHPIFDRVKAMVLRELNKL